MHRIEEVLEAYSLKNRHCPATPEGLDRIVKAGLLKLSDRIDNFGEAVLREAPSLLWL